MKLTLRRTNSEDKDFQMLVARLDHYLAIIDGDEHDFYNQFNQLDMLNEVVMCYVDDLPTGCGALKAFDKNAIELKRMYVLPEYRGKGIALKILNELEDWANESGYSKCVLETGKRMPDAVRFYQKNGYRQVPNYGQYIGMENSVCFEKTL